MTSPALLAVGTIFGVSGVTALVYQVAWQRILVLHSGVGIYSVAMIVAAFLAGLGIGSYVGGAISARTSRRRALLAFALVETAIGLFAFASCYLYYDVLYVRASDLYVEPFVAGLLHFLALLPPTTLMGMSLPLLAHATVDDPRTASRTLGFLYGVNLLGAAAGAVLAPWVLMRFLGIEGAVAAAGCGNLFVGIGAWVLGRNRAATETVAPEQPAPEQAAPQESTVTERAGRHPFGMWLGLYTLSGFCALSLEILWFRIVDVAVKSTAFTFGTVLAIFLLGLAVGSFLGARIAPRIRRPLLVFLSVQGSMLSLTGLAVVALINLPANSPFYRELVVYWGQYQEFELGRSWEWGRLLSLYFVLPVALYGLPTVLMGFSFGVLQRAVQDDRGTVGRKVGILQAGNIVGNVAGSLVTGLLLLHVLGTAGALRVMLGLGLVFVGLGLRHYGPRLPLVAPGSILVALLIFLPSGPQLWQRLHGQIEIPSLIDEDATTVAAMTIARPTQIQFSVNGKGHSWLPFGGFHSQLGAIPALVHAAPDRVAVIGLGSGDTAWAAACRRKTSSVTVYELASPEKRLLEELLDHAPLPRLRSFLADPRITILTADGRNALAQSERRFDVIEADALRPRSAYSGNLYSREFFELCSRRLARGGIMTTWAPTKRIYRTFCDVFPHVLEFDRGAVLVGSRTPFDVDVETLRARLDPSVREYLGTATVEGMLRILATLKPADATRYAHLQPNRDLFPRDELSTPDQD